MIDPRTVLVAIPCYSGRNVCELTGMLWTWQGLFGPLSLPAECSHPSLVRNIIAGQFLDSPFEWLVCIDDDIVPSRRDMELLLQPTDPDAVYYTESNDATERPPQGACTPQGPQPTRIAVGLVEDGQRDLNCKQVGAADVLVNAEYCYKDDELKPVKFGLGFTRIHRSVFRTLENLKHELNPQHGIMTEVANQMRAEGKHLREMLEVTSESIRSADRLDALSDIVMQNLPDPGGGPRLYQTQHKGKLYTDFFPSGPLLSQFVPTAEWKGEDHGFFTLCMIAGIVPRIETRTRLVHIGRKGYPYLGPDTGLAI